MNSQLKSKDNHEHLLCEYGFKRNECYPIKFQCTVTCKCVQSSNPIPNKQTMQITQRYGFRNSIEQTVSPCIAHVQGSCFT